MHAFTVALTGGIACGKSEVARRFAALSADVVDADVVAHELVRPGTPALAEIASEFGAGVLDEAGALDRRAMREHIFGDSDAKKKLESILHPRVLAELRARTRASAGPYVMLVIPLFVETGAYGWVDRVLVIDVPRELQIARIVARDDITPELATAMVDAQATREQRLAVADDVIDNSGPLSNLDAAVPALHAKYVALAAQKAKRSPSDAN
ncbi:MAG: dephospho-CoA kinase [Rhodanobacteraceae bacterium]